MWIPLICWKLKTYCWKYCNKINFKCVKSAMGPKFCLKSVFGWLLWVREQYSWDPQTKCRMQDWAKRLIQTTLSKNKINYILHLYYIFYNNYIFICYFILNIDLLNLSFKTISMKTIASKSLLMRTIVRNHLFFIWVKNYLPFCNLWVVISNVK